MTKVLLLENTILGNNILKSLKKKILFLMNY